MAVLLQSKIGVDKDSGLVHNVVIMGANVNDVTVTSQSLSGEEGDLFLHLSFWQCVSIIVLIAFSILGLIIIKLKRKSKKVV